MLIIIQTIITIKNTNIINIISLAIHTETTIIILTTILRIVNIKDAITILTQTIDTIINFIHINTGIVTITIDTALTNAIISRIQNIKNIIAINRLTNRASMMAIGKNIRKELLNWVTKQQYS